VPRDGRGREPAHDVKAYRSGVAAFAVLFIALGFAILIRTALEGGGIGFVLGGLFVAVGAGRLYLLRRG
jgi:hypothetical protein